MAQNITKFIKKTIRHGSKCFISRQTTFYQVYLKSESNPIVGHFADSRLNFAQKVSEIVWTKFFDLSFDPILQVIIIFGFPALIINLGLQVSPEELNWSQVRYVRRIIQALDIMNICSIENFRLSLCRNEYLRGLAKTRIDHPNDILRETVLIFG